MKKIKLNTLEHNRLDAKAMEVAEYIGYNIKLKIKDIIIVQ